MINIVDKQIERVDPLLQTLFDPIPFSGFDNARYDIKGEYLFSGGAVAIDVKGDAVLQQQPFGGGLAG